MKKLILILLLTVWSCFFSSRVEARPYLKSGTTWRQVTSGTLGMTLGGGLGGALGAVVANTVNDRFFSGENQKLSLISYGFGYLVATEICARGIELGYQETNGKEYRGSMRNTRAAVGLGIPIAALGMVGGAIGILSVGMAPGSASNTPDVTILLLPIAIIVIPAVCLTLPSILGAKAYNKSLELQPVEAEINILRVAF